MNKEIEVFAMDYREAPDKAKPLPFTRVSFSRDPYAIITTDTGPGDFLSGIKYSPSLCEGVSIYWIWKHLETFGNPNYVGVTHYRRFFGNPNFAKGPVKNGLTWDNYDIWHTHIITPIQQLLTIQHYDAMGIMPMPLRWSESVINTLYRLAEANRDSETKENWGLTKQLIDYTFAALIDFAPASLKPGIHQALYNVGESYYHCNISTLRRDIFDEYCSLMFKTLFYVIENYEKDTGKKLQLDTRWGGFLMERITSGIIHGMEITRKYNFIKLPLMVITKYNNAQYAEPDLVKNCSNIQN